MSLSIVVPTYNRPELCNSQLHNIYSSISGWSDKVVIDITVLNNSSTSDYTLVQQTCLRIGAKYHQSAANVGFNGNYCRAVSSGVGEYIWVISDDDIVRPTAVHIILSLISAKKSPDIITFSHHLDIPVFTGSINEYIDRCMNINPLTISELTLVTNLVYKRCLFNYSLFWCSEPMWFPHAYSVIGNALRENCDIVAIGSKKLVFQTGNTEIERASSPKSNYNLMLEKQFQRAILEFINMCLAEAKLNTKTRISDEQYIQLVVRTFGCNPSAVIKGMNPIERY